MKKLILLIALAISAISSMASDEVSLKAKIEKVTVFPGSAQIYETAAINVQPGVFELMFENVPENIDEQSIQVSGKGNYTIMEVFKDVKYNEVSPALSKHQKLINQIKDSLDNQRYESDRLTARIDALGFEKNTLLSSRYMKGDFKKDSIILLKDAMDYLRSRLNNINEDLLKNKREQTRVLKHIDRMQKTINDLQQTSVNNGDPKPVVHRIKIIISTEVPVTGTVSVNYLTYNATWIPFYDIRVNDAKGGIQLSLKAKVKQFTGVDWKNCPITLSTSNPSSNNNIPYISAQYLNFYNYPQKLTSRKDKAYDAPAAVAQSKAESTGMQMDELTNAYQSSDFVEQQEFLSTQEFTLKLNYTVPSDNKDHVVAVTTKDVSSTFSHTAVPKLDKDAFLVANLTGFEELNLLPAEGNIYFNGTYIGKNYINPSETEDTLQISLGRDKNIVINRKRLKNDTKSKIIGDDIEKTVAFEIEIRNTGSFATTISIDDQIPVSQTNEIKVELLESDKAVLDEATGKLTWKIDLKPKENKKVTFKYKVKHPKNKPVYGI